MPHTHAAALTIKRALYMLCQCTWGLLQTLTGLVLFIIYFRGKHYLYHGAAVTVWPHRSSASLGLFIFIAEDPYNHLASAYAPGELAARLLVHEYGHTVQSLLLGPLYLFVIFLPSALWAGLPSLKRKRIQQRTTYFSFFTERWADRWGEKALGENSMAGVPVY